MTKTEIASLALSHIGARPLADIATDTTQQALVANQWFTAAQDEALASHPWNFAIKRAVMTTSYVSLSGAADGGGLIQITKAAHGLATGTRIYVKDVLGVPAANGRWFITATGDNTFTLDGSTFSGAYTSGGAFVVIPAFGWDFRHALPADSLRILKIGGDEGQADDDGEDYQIENGFILTGNETPEVRYIHRNETYTAWPQYFINAFSYLLASCMAQNLAGPAGQALQLRQAYEQTFLPKARAQDARESKPRRTLPFDDSQLLQARGGAIA